MMAWGLSCGSPSSLSPPCQHRSQVAFLTRGSPAALWSRVVFTGSISVPGAPLSSVVLAAVLGEMLTGQAEVMCASINQSLGSWEAGPALSGGALAKCPPTGWGQFLSNHLG